MRHCIATPRVSIALLRRDVDRRLVQPVPRGDEDLALHEVDAGDHLGHRVLDLDARVDLDEVELVRAPGRRGTRRCRPRGSATDRAERGRRRRRCRARRSRGSVDRSARSRPLSGAAAAPSSRAPRDGPGCRGRRRAPAPRCAWRGRCSARGTPRAARTRRAASRCASVKLAVAARRPSGRRACPRPPPPKLALMISGIADLRAPPRITAAGSSTAALGARNGRHAGALRQLLAPPSCRRTSRAARPSARRR